MSKVKAAGSSKNVHDSPGQVIVRQAGMTKRAGKGTFISRNFTIHAAKDGVVVYKKRRFKLFSGKTTPRTEVTVE
jgi:large subunit ribosomal protein L27